jgi:hypothetical protein
MGEFVGVSPDNLQELTNRLQKLHDVLATRGPLIRQKIQSWHGDVSFAALPRLIDEALNDARDMAARTTKAYQLATLKGWNPLHSPPLTATPFSLPAPHVQLDWTTTAQSPFQAEQDTKALATVLSAGGASRDIGVVRAALRQALEHLRAHPDDKDYLAAFWPNAIPSVLKAVQLLRKRDSPNLLSTEDAGIIGGFATALATATRLKSGGGGQDSAPLLPATTRSAVTNASDKWAAGMLLKYGPNGKAWDPDFLADITRSMLDARKAGKIVVPLPPGKGTSLPDQERDWELSQKIWANYDPTTAVLDRATENGTAARHVLGNPTSGAEYAKMLVNDSWHTPGVDISYYAHFAGTTPPATNVKVFQLDQSPHAAAFLKSATSAPRGTTPDAKESAWSVVNIVKATSEFSKLHPTTTLPKETRQALIYIADRYLPDLAASAHHGFGSGVRLRGDDPHGPWMTFMETNDLTSFLKQALHDPRDLGIFQGKMDARVSASVTASIKDSGTNYLSEMGQMYGMLARIQGDLSFDKEQTKDLKAERLQTAMSMMAGGFGALSFSNPLGTATAAQVFVSFASPPAAELLSTDHAVNALKTNVDNYREQLLHIKIPVVQGLINSGVVQLPAHVSWVQNGVISPTADFSNWYGTHEKKKFAGRSLEDWVRDAENAMQVQR